MASQSVVNLDRVLILGASSDIGLALLRALDGEAGLIVAHANQGLERLRAHAATARSRVACVQADLADGPQVQALAAAVQAQCPCPTAIVHLAAPRLRVGRFKDDARAEMEQNFQVQVQGPAELLRHVLPAMAQAGQGQALFLLSDVTTGPVPGGMAPYVAAKFALLGLLKALAAEYGPRGLAFQGLSPGMADTAFLQHLHRTVSERAAKASPRGRNWTAEEVAQRLKALLAGPPAENGANLPME
jgi:3-oxoacyl-[acyl-carrier protein] reductase